MLQSIDSIHGSYCLAACVLCVGDGIKDTVLQKDLEDSTSFFVDETTDKYAAHHHDGRDDG